MIKPAPATVKQPSNNQQPPSGGQSVPLGMVVHTMPAGCAPASQGGVEYYYCGGAYYRAEFQGNNLVYVATTP